jgi:hypothetical protein
LARQNRRPGQCKLGRKFTNRSEPCQAFSDKSIVHAEKCLKIPDPPLRTAGEAGGSEVRASRHDVLGRLRETLERISEMTADLEDSASPAAAVPGIVT